MKWGDTDGGLLRLVRTRSPFKDLIHCESVPPLPGVGVTVQDAGILESQAMLISGHETRSMLERYIVSLKNLQDAGAKLDALSRPQKNTVQVPISKTEANPKQTPSKKAEKDAGGKRRKMV
jgi:hypothetical protein